MTPKSFGSIGAFRAYHTNDEGDYRMRVFMTGGTGLIGVRLIRALRARGDDVSVLSRQPEAWTIVGPDVTVIAGDPMQPGDWQAKAAECDAIVNLAGANIFARRWNTEFKQLLRDSRLRSTQHVVAAISKSPKRADGSPKVLVNASAIGCYGSCGDEKLDERSPPGGDFMAQLCRDWEAAARNAESAGVRVAHVRTGIVLDPRGGALQALLTPFKLGAGGPIGSGKQYMSWIHYADIVGIFMLALDNAEATGAINGTAPEPVTNKAFGKALGAALGRSAFLPTPGFALKLLLGEVAAVLTTGQRVSPAKAQALGYRFQFPEIGAALPAVVEEIGHR
jgi:uncharacterized protein